MAKHWPFSSGDVLPSGFIGALEEYVGTVTSALRLTASATAVSATALADTDQVCVGVRGIFRYRTGLATTPVSVTISGGAATYDLHIAVASPTSASNPAGGDGTTNWYLLSSAAGGSPSGTLPPPSGGTAIAYSRKIGEVDWDGTKITALRQLVGLTDATGPITPTAPAAAVTPLTARGASSQSANLLNIGSSSSATDRLTLNSAGQLALPVAGNTGGLLLGSDASLYRSAALTLRTNSALIVDGALTASSTLGVTGATTLAALTANGAVSFTDNALIAGSGKTLGFFGTGSPVTKRTGYSATAIGGKRTLSASSTLTDVIAVVTNLVTDLQSYGLIA